MSDLISREDAIQAKPEFLNTNVVRDTEERTAHDRAYAEGWNACNSEYISNLLEMPSVQPESYKEKLKEIADALSEKFAYMNTCLNERDIILGYLGVKRPSKIHCNTDCTNIECKIHPYNKRLPSAQPERNSGEWLFEEYPDGYYHSECSVCKHWFVEDAFLKPYNFCPNCGARMLMEGE